MDLPRVIGQRIGVLGGTFDPVHNGHMALVEAAMVGLGLDSLVLIPAAVPPHKLDLPVTSLVHRLGMLRLAAAGRSGLYVSTIEAERSGPSYSIDTLSALRSHFGSEVTLFFLIGIDAFVEIHTWKNYQRLPALADLVVVDRAEGRSMRWSEVVASRFVGYCPDIEQGVWQGVGGGGVIRNLDMALVDISSTTVRKLVAAGQAVGDLIPDAVEDYIHLNSLYKEK